MGRLYCINHRSMNFVGFFMVKKSSSRGSVFNGFSVCSTRGFLKNFVVKLQVDGWVSPISVTSIWGRILNGTGWNHPPQPSIRYLRHGMKIGGFVQPLFFSAKAVLFDSEPKELRTKNKKKTDFMTWDEMIMSYESYHWSPVSFRISGTTMDVSFCPGVGSRVFMIPNARVGLCLKQRKSRSFHPQIPQIQHQIAGKCELSAWLSKWATVKTLMTFHCTDWFIGILRTAYYNPYTYTTEQNNPK